MANLSVTESRQFVTAEQLAERFQISERAVRFHAQTGEIPAIKIGNVWRFDVQDIEAWIRQQKAARRV